MKITEKEFLDLYQQGKKDSEIARISGDSESTINQLRKKLNLSPNNRVIVTDDKFLDFYKKGLIDSDICKITGASPAQISRKRNKLGLKVNKKQTPLTLHFLELYNQGYNDYKIANILKVSSSSVQNYRSKQNLEPINKIKINEEELINLFNQGLSDKEIANKMNYSPQHIKRTRLKLKLYRGEIKKPNNYIYNNEEYQVILGSLLGDGHLCKKFENSGVILSIKHCEKQKEYVEYKQNILKNNSCLVYKQQCYDDRFKNPNYINYGFYTYSSISLIDMYNRWYNPIKHICIEDFKKINGLGLAIWYMDDGSKCKDGGGIISTNCFSLEELEQVKNILYSKFNINIHIYNTTNTIYIPASDFNKFKILIEPYIIPCMKYKLSSL